VSIGLLLCVIPGVLMILVTPLYIHHVFTTDLNLMTCMNKAFKGMFQGFGSFSVVSFLCFLAVPGSTAVFPLLILAVLPMTALYLQNYIHHKGLVSTRSLPEAA